MEIKKTGIMYSDEYNEQDSKEFYIKNDSKVYTFELIEI